ncbi:ATP-binding cassette domain-containing protein [Desulfitobacterium sp. PCE1]|uniref:ATP-binding cassette domain-containing protein n=1 Tax=Desulfitobacterium sp. PCE1 TaxID=146907 RepID=UPI000377368F|nr:ATP-binding cassette domain-containing protein [Desulfitobacterium sp. PCE1]
MLSVKELSFYYQPERIILKDISFELNSHDILCLLGPNGTGKTTLLRCILSLHKMKRGRITLNGLDLNKIPPKKRAELMAYVPQATTVAFPYEAAEIVQMGRVANLALGARPSSRDRKLAEEAMEKMGIQQFHISGGTDLDEGYDEQLLELVRKIKARSGLKLEINLGPSFRKETILELKKLGIDSITSSLECNAPEVFAAAKPGDSLERRRELLQCCEEVDIPSRSMMLLGLGETDEDRIEHLFFMKQFEKLYQLRLSRFMPFPGTPYKDRPRCSPWDSALITAMARLVLPNVEICLAAGNSTDDIPLWYLAGGGNQLLGVSLTRKEPPAAPDIDVYKIEEGAYVVDKRKQVIRVLEGMNLEVTCEMPDYQRVESCHTQF